MPDHNADDQQCHRQSELQRGLMGPPTADPRIDAAPETGGRRMIQTLTIGIQHHFEASAHRGGVGSFGRDGIEFHPDAFQGLGFVATGVAGDQMLLDVGSPRLFQIVR
jgi:hypothetical protein